MQRELARLVGREKREWHTLMPSEHLKAAAFASVYKEATAGYAAGMGSKKQRSALQGRLQAKCVEELRHAFPREQRASAPLVMPIEPLRRTAA